METELRPPLERLGQNWQRHIQVGGAETLLDDSTRVAATAARDGVEVRLDVFPGMQHVFQMAAGNMPEADDAVARIGEWLRPKLAL